MSEPLRIKRGNWGGLEAFPTAEGLVLCVSEDETEGQVASVALTKSEAAKLAQACGVYVRSDSQMRGAVMRVAKALQKMAPNEALEFMRACS